MLMYISACLVFLTLFLISIVVVHPIPSLGKSRNTSCERFKHDQELEILCLSDHIEKLKIEWSQNASLLKVICIKDVSSEDLSDLLQSVKINKLKKMIIEKCPVTVQLFDSINKVHGSLIYKL